MIEYIKIKNYSTFESEQIFSLVGGKERKKKEHLIPTSETGRSLLKLAMVYGMNGAGKSNLVDAIATAKMIAVDRIMIDLSQSYCRFDEKNRLESTMFEFGLILGRNRYSYRLEIDASSSSLLKEKICDSGSGRLLFSRDYISHDAFFEPNFFVDDKARGRLEMYHEDSIMNRQSSFLSVMNQDKNQFYDNYATDGATIFRDIFKTLKEMLVVVKPDMAIKNAVHYSSEESLDKISELLRSFDIGITSLGKEDIQKNELALALNNPIAYSEIINSFMVTTSQAFNEAKMRAVSGILHVNNDMYLLHRSKGDPDIKLNKIFAKHKNNPSEKYRLSEESDGTRRLLELIEVLINDTDNKTFVIDEFDRCLHPLIAKRFISKFLESKTKSQLVVTTHQDDLLDQELVRRDEIWFADRLNDMETNLYSLVRFGDRFDKALQKAYLSGAYGAIPKEVSM